MSDAESRERTVEEVLREVVAMATDGKGIGLRELATAEAKIRERLCQELAEKLRENARERGAWLAAAEFVESWATDRKAER